MKLRIAASLFMLAFVAALVAAGFSAAWFRAQDVLPAATAFQVGALDIEITGEQAQPDAYRWEIGEGESCRDFSWVIKNTGTKRAFLRARLEETIYISDESAWGQGSRFVDRGSWAMYFLYYTGDNYGEANPLSVPLLAGQHHPAGTVAVWHEAGNNGDPPTLFVEYRALGWQLAELHLAVAGDLALIPQNNAGNPQVGRFPFTAELEGPVGTYTFAIPMQGVYPAGALRGRPYDWAAGSAATLYIAAHAALIGPEGAETGMSWSQRGCAFPWTYNEADGYWYYCAEPVYPGNEVRLCLTGCPEYAGLYTVKLRVEALQAHPDALQVRWGGALPCLQGS